jgi:hypothetical protein
MSPLFFEAYGMLVQFDLYLMRGKFGALYEKVRRYPVRTAHPSPGAADRVCAAVDLAAIWYWKEVLCLQRSAATACLLRRHGVRARLIVGVQQIPFKAHAWVEVDGQVVNDKPYMSEMYAVLDRC